MFKETLKAIWYRLAQLCCRAFCIVFFRMRFCGLENVPSYGSFVLAANHQSFLDPIFSGAALKRQLCYMARDTLFKNRIFGWIIRSLNAIPVRRGRADISAIRTVIAKLRQGWGVCLYPEATRTTDGRIASFKGGFTLLCRRANAPVVPLLIEGAFECWPRHKKLFRPGAKVAVCYGKPIPAEQIMKMEDEDFARLLTDTLRNMQAETRIKQGKQPLNYS
jgi:1-acyl-sn-glycerol-3-phosphate acyltransferase